MTRRIAWLVVFAVPLGAAPTRQFPVHSIRNFRAFNVSSAELRITVDYTLVTDPGEGGVTIQAIPMETGGIFDPRTVEVTELPVRRGTHAPTLTIAKRQGARNFTSTSIRVCLSTPGRAILCEDFAHVKAWRDVVSVPQPPPSPPPPPVEKCSITGDISGPLRWRVKDDRGQFVTFVLREVQLSDGTVRRRARLSGTSGRTYLFTDIPAGVVYRIFPSNFRAQPAERTVSCLANTTHRRRDFLITAPPPQG